MAESDEQFEPEIDGFPVDLTPERIKGRDSVELLASEFLDRTRNGDSVTIEDYVAKYPQMETQIRELFPTIMMLEQWKGEREAECLRRQLPESFSIEQLGDCEIVREVGRGGMGIVFEALQGPLKRQVAVKLLPWRFSAVPRWRERFEQEALTVARLKHPNIVPIYSLGKHEGYAYFVMQFIDGVGLDVIIRRLLDVKGVKYSDEIRQRNLASGTSPNSATHGFQHQELRRDSWSGFAKVAVQVSQALNHAHAEGVLHNDIKPANLLLTAAGRLSVTDFGLAKSLEDAGEERRVTGTLRYMAPERFNLDHDARSDLYSLGVTLYELATQRPFVQAEDRTEMIRIICEDDACRPRLLNREIPKSLETIILTAIDRNPDQRYQKASEFTADLLRFINGKTVRGHGTSRFQRSWNRIRTAFGRNNS